MNKKAFRKDTLEMLRRMAYGLCEHCGNDYAAHDPSPQPSCQQGCDCPHCHESDFHCASDDPTLIGREGLRLIYESIPRDDRSATMSCIYKLNDELVCGGEPTDGVHFPCNYCAGVEDGPEECEAEVALGIRCHLFTDHTNRDMFPAYATAPVNSDTFVDAFAAVGTSAGTKAMDEIKDSLFAPIGIPDFRVTRGRAKGRSLADLLEHARPTAPITDADIQNAEALQDEAAYAFATGASKWKVSRDDSNAKVVIEKWSTPITDHDILRAAAHILRMAKETGPTKMTTVLYLDQYASEAEKAEEEA